MQPLRSLHVRGFKSFETIDLVLRGRVNVLVGANGSGKSNFVSLFRFLDALVSERLQEYVGRGGGAGRFLYYGAKVTNAIQVSLRSGLIHENRYTAALVPTVDDALVFTSESLFYHGAQKNTRTLGAGHSETKLVEAQRKDPKGIPGYAHLLMSSWQVYHFHDTSAQAPVKARQPLADYQTLRGDAGNLAPFLYSLKGRDYAAYEAIRDAVRLMFPQFGDFMLDPLPGEETLRLLWREAESDIVFGPNQLSDGTLRFICLATVFLQPTPPATILVDEPELGLHPAALALLADLVRQAAERRQVVLTTQSVTFLDAFAPGEVIVVDRERHSETGRYTSVCKRLSDDEFAGWLEDYTLGDLWLKNVLGGRP